jgi:hypoxanthine-DNA glycosylase
MAHFEHPFAPIFNKKSTILILGTFPSVASRKQEFYYAHPQNRFWKIIASLTKTDPVPFDIDRKKQMLLINKIALWDVVRSCDIEGSDDSRIGNVTPADLPFLLENATSIKHIFTNGRRARQLYGKYFTKNLSINVTALPSTSPANAAYCFEKLLHSWEIMGRYLN